MTRMIFLTMIGFEKLFFFSFKVKYLKLGFSMENRFSFYEKCRNGSVYWAYFKVNPNGYDKSGQCLLTKMKIKI